MNRSHLKRATEELNLLYHEPQFVTTTGKVDSGWFCREHAFHTYCLYLMYGNRTSIALGNYCIISHDGHVNLSIDDPHTHAWCVSGSGRPIDLSISFRYSPQYGRLTPPIVGTGKNDDYEIRYYNDPSEFAKNAKYDANLGTLSYLEQTIIQPDPEDLMRNPFSFLLPGRRGSYAMTWGDVYGMDIYAKISLHVYKYAKKQVPSFAKESKGRKPIEWISSNYSAAIPKIMKIVKAQHAPPVQASPH